MSDFDGDATRLPEGSRPEVEGSLGPGMVLGDYRIERLLGRGAMGEVYLALHTGLRKHYALKTLPKSLSRSSNFQMRFKDEARTLAQLEHAHVVPVHNYGEAEGVSFLVMGYVEGGSLEDYLNVQGGKLPTSEVATILRQVLEGLNYAHGRGVIHRDLKPGNILLESGKQSPNTLKPSNLIPNHLTAKISDFGLAQVVGDEFIQSMIQQTVTQSMLAHDQDATRLEGSTSGSTSSYIGTLDYMSPEVRNGGSADARSDLYAVGVMAYYLLTGRKPIGRAKAASALVPGLPKQWDVWIDRAMEAEPEERFQDASAMLSAVPSGRPVSGKGKWLGLAALLLVGVGIAGYVMRDAGGSADSLTATSIELSPGEAVESGQSSEDREQGVGSLPTPHSPLFTLRVEPPDSAARVWLGSHTNVPVKDGGLDLSGLAEGEHELIVQAVGYEPLTTRVSVGVGGLGSETVKLVPVKGRLLVETDAGVAVTAISASGREIGLGQTDAQGVLRVDRILNVGAYDLRLEKAAHSPQTLEGVELILGREIKAEADLQPLPGKLSVFTLPQGASITVNGQSLGKSSTTLENIPTEVPLVVEVHKAGYRRERETLTLAAAGSRNLNFGSLVAEAGDIELRIKNEELKNPEKLTWYIDGEKMADGGWRIADVGGSLKAEGLELGGRSLRVEHPDYEGWTGQALVADQEVSEVAVRLVPKPGTMVLEVSPVGVSYRLEVNGHAVQAQGEHRYPVAAGEDLKLSVIAKGYKAVTLEGRVGANGVATVPVRLVKVVGPEPGRDWSLSLPGSGGALTMKWIAPGSFQMGSNDGASDEKPVHGVTLTKGYHLGATEVTQAQWESVMGSNPSKFKGRDLPVEQVSWEDAMSFCAKLTASERAAGRLASGDEYTLPSEAQWEYACRAGTTGAYAGDLDSMGWYDKNSGNKTHAVGTKRANAWGLYDMHGNVWEWCSDWYGSYPSGSVVDPAGARSGTLRVLRGGCWRFNASYCRSANRGWDSPGDRGGNLGFRLAHRSVQD